MQAFVYILECRGGAFYVGSTSDLDRRLAEHQRGIGSEFVRSRRPVKLIYSQEFSSLRQAFEAERQMKGWRREKKLAVIRGNWELLPELADTRSPVVLREPQDDI